MGSLPKSSEVAASSGQHLDDLDTSKIPEPQSTFFHSTLDGAHTHVEFVCYRLEATFVAHEGINQSRDGFALASDSCKVSFGRMGIVFEVFDYPPARHHE